MTTNILNKMDTAPLDGTFVLLFGDSDKKRTDLCCQICRFVGNRWKTVDGVRFKNEAGVVEPLFWFPLPDRPPEDKYNLVKISKVEDEGAIVPTFEFQPVETGDFDEIAKKLKDRIPEQNDNVKYFMEKA